MEASSSEPATKAPGGYTIPQSDDAADLHVGGAASSHFKRGRVGTVIFVECDDHAKFYSEFEDGAFQRRWASAFVPATECHPPVDYDREWGMVQLMRCPRTCYPLLNKFRYFTGAQIN